MTNPLYRNSKYVHLWVHLLLKANHKGDKIMWNGGILNLESGQFIAGRKSLSNETGIAESTCEDILRFLEKEGQIRQQSNSKFRVITILKWKDYQESDNKTTASRQPADTNKNDKNDKNVKNKTTAPETGDGALINEAISLFEKVNPNYRIWYARPPQRNALGRLIEINGFEKVRAIIALLPQSNILPYLPTITTPIQLEERWASLAAGLIKKKGELTSKGRGMA